MLGFENDYTGWVIELYLKKRAMWIWVPSSPVQPRTSPTGQSYDAVYLAGPIIRSPRTNEG